MKPPKFPIESLKDIKRGDRFMFTLYNGKFKDEAQMWHDIVKKRKEEHTPICLKDTEYEILIEDVAIEMNTLVEPVEYYSVVMKGVIV